VDVTLPDPVTISAPRRALYGVNTVFTGTGRPGDSVHLTRVRAPGFKPVCTITTAADPTPCSPRWAAVYDRLARTAKVGRDGKWSLSVRLRTEPRPTVLGSAHPASGRYAVVDYTGDAPWATPKFNGGAVSIIQASATPTRVVLDRPRLTLRRAGSRLAVNVRVPGGDPAVQVRLSAGSRMLATGALDARGAFRTSVRAPHGGERIAAHVSVPGAGPASASVVAP
jgi:hypothetical protein